MPSKKSRDGYFEYIEITCKSQRRHSYLGYPSPDDYEKKYSLINCPLDQEDHLVANESIVLLSI